MPCDRNDSSTRVTLGLDGICRWKQCMNPRLPTLTSAEPLRGAEYLVYYCL